MPKCLIVLIFALISASASPTGIIAGLVLDDSGDPLVGATVNIEGTQFGAMTSNRGEFVISTVSPGEYTIVARMVGRSTSRVEGVTVQSDNTSIVNFELEEDAFGSTVISVVQSRSQILRDVPATAYQLDLSEMRTMAANRLVDVVAAQPGVVQQDGELHVRGGRSGEVDYVLDGVSLRSPMDNRFNFDIPISAVSGATLMTGGLSIEYGNTISGVVDLIGREGGERFEATITGRVGDMTSSMLSSGEQVFMESIDIDQCRTDLTNIELSLSGPEPLTGLFLPGETSISVSGQVSASGNENLDSRGNWSYNSLNDGSCIVKLTNKPLPRTTISLSALGSYREHGWNQWAWNHYDDLSFAEGQLIPPHDQDYALPAMFSQTEGLILNLSQLIGEKTSFSFTAGNVRFENWNRVFDRNGGYLGEGENTLFWLFKYSPPPLIEDTLGLYYNGVHHNVWHDSKSTVSTAMANLDITPNPRMRLKLGVTGHYYDLYQFNVYHLSQGNSYISLWDAYPHSVSAYAQGSYRFSGGVITTAGLRMDYFNPNTSLYFYEEGVYEKVDGKTHFSPRFSFSVPFSERSLFFTTYGQYFQMPSMNSLFLQTTYNTGADRVIAGNPDLEPELTSLFEVGIRQEMGIYTDLALSFYNKDITGLVSTEDKSEGLYYVFSNDDSHGNVKGLELSLTRAPESNLSGQIFYSLSIAKGRYSSMLQRYNYAQREEFYVSREDTFLDWDQTHQAGVTAGLNSFRGEGPTWAGVHPFENSALSVSWKFGSGMPYSIPAQSSVLIESNTERRPFTMQTDLSMSRSFQMGPRNIMLMLGVYNLFNRRNVIHIYDRALFHSTGDPTGILGNPRSWSPARHFLLSAVFSW